MIPNLTPFSDQSWIAKCGDIIVKCIKADGYTMTDYGQYSWDEGEERSILHDMSLPDTLRANDFSTAKTMVIDLNYELAQCIQNGDFEVVSIVNPDPGLLAFEMGLIKNG